VYVVHLTVLMYFVPLRGLFSDEPIHGIDFDLHAGQVFRVVEALEHYGRSWLYDVELLAGQPEGTITDSGSKAWELWTFALHHYFGASRAIAFNTFILVVMLSGPGLIYLAGRILRLGVGASIMAAAMASTLLFFDSFVHWLWYIGMVSWVLASCLSVLTFALFYRLVEDETLALVVPCCLCLGIGLLIHPYTFFSLVVPLAICYLRRLRSLSVRAHIAIAVIIAVAIAINAYWLRNALRHWHYILNSAYYAQGRPFILVCDLLDLMCSPSDTGVIGTRTGFRIIFQGLALGGLWLWHRERDRRLVPLGAGLVALYCMTYFGNYTLGLSQTQPYRQLSTALWMTLLPAASFLQVIVRDFRWSSLELTTKILISVVGFGLAKQLMTSQVIYFTPRLIPEPDSLVDGTRPPLTKYGFWAAQQAESHVHYGLPHDRTVKPGVEETVAWVRERIPTGARILVEGGPLGERLAWRTHHEVLGGFLERNVQHVDANFYRRFAHTAPTPADLARYLQFYAVQWVIGNHPVFAESPESLELVANTGGRNVYRARAPTSRVLSQHGSVRARMNEIQVQGSEPNEDIILSYHFHEALRCRPNCRLERWRVDYDRVGMIRVPSPHPASVTIYNSYDFPRAATGIP
jgi:hypothetical protein